MQKLRHYNLEFESAYKYLESCLSGVNVLSECLLDLDFSLGSFFTLLPEDVNTTKLVEFELGGMTKNLRDEVGAYIQKTVQSNISWSCIFDDFNADFKELGGNSLYWQCGLHLSGQIYYVINNRNLARDLVTKCLQYSNTIWHSLCVLTSADFNNVIGQKLTLEKLNEVCLNAKMIIVGAYDGEGYVFWEKHSDVPR